MDVRTDENDQGDVGHNERDDNVAADAGNEHRYYPHHGQDRCKASVVLVVQLNMNVSELFHC